MTNRLDLALQHCADLGIEVEWRDLGLKRRGGYDWRQQKIILSTRLTTIQALCSLWHEIGHHIFGDTCSTPAAERRAWEYAAAVLITPADYAEAEELVGCHENALAIHLGVTPRVIRSWRTWWETKGHRAGETITATASPDRAPASPHGPASPRCEYRPAH